MAKKNVKAKAVARPSVAKAQSTKAIVKKSVKTASSKATTSKVSMKKPTAKAVSSSKTSPKPVAKASVAKTAQRVEPKKSAPVAKAAPTVAKASDKPALQTAVPVKQAVKPEAPAAASAAKIKTIGAPVGTAATHRPIRPIASVAAVIARPANGSGGHQRPMPAVVTKPASPKLSAPVGPDPVLEAARQAAAAAAAAAALAAKKPVSSRHGFKTNESIVYPAHGVGRIVGIEEQEIAGISLELFVIQFEKDKMTLRVPTSKLASVGMRKLAEDNIVTRAMDTLKGKARIKRTMWSRRAQEYEAKINSGDLIAIAEVVRDLYRSEAQPEQSYSERQLYEAALDRMAREIAAVEKLDERGAIQRITEVLSKSARGRRAAEEAASANEADIKAA